MLVILVEYAKLKIQLKEKNSNLKNLHIIENKNKKLLANKG